MNKKKYLKFLYTTGFLCVVFLLSVDIQAQVVKTSQTTGNWSNITWNPTGLPNSFNDVIINREVTIPFGTTVEINNLDIAKDGILIVEGTLKVRGNLIMSHNTSKFQMGSSAYVLVNGNFSASNQVEISVSSYLIIQGNFTKTGSSTQGELVVSSGHIYIFGTVDPNWTNFDNCENYEGNTNAIENEECDYGTGQDYINNFENFPPALQELRNCFNISTLSDQNLCDSQEAVFSINPVSGVNYQWQVKSNTSTTWGNVGTNAPSLTLPTITPTMNGNSYRVVVKSINTTATCNVSVSNTAVLSVESSEINIGSITGPDSVCSESLNLTYSIPPVANATLYSWTFPDGWAIINGSNTNSIIVQAGRNALSGAITVTVSTDCKSEQTTLNVSVLPKGKWTGEIDSDWNNPSNWSCNTLPTPDTNVLIPEDVASGNYPLVSLGTNAFAKDLIIEAGASVTVTDNWLKIVGEVQNFGVFNAINGSVSFEGATAQFIPSATFDNNRIENLLINNVSGVTSEGAIEITGILKVASGNFNTGNSLTLISSAEKTALIDGSGMGEVSGTISMQRILNPAYGYKYFSSPFSETKAGDFTDIDFTSEFPNFYRYDENRSLMQGEERNDATGWEAITDATSTLNILEGYALNFGEGTTTVVVELTGAVNNGSFSRTLENNNREYTRGFHLIGNPYPSPIDWDATEGWDKTNIENGIYFFTAGETQYTGTYTSYVNGISTEDGRASSIIPSMQGFFVKVTDPPEGVAKVTGSLSVTNKTRVTDFDQEFLKSHEQEERPLLGLKAGYEAATKKDAMVIYFSANSDTRFNKEMDAHKLMNTDASVPNLYSLSEDKINLSIKALPFPETGSYEKIPLGILAEKSGRMNIELTTLENIPEHWNIYLIDKEKRTGQDLRRSTSYSFYIKAGKHHERFQLMFSKEKLSDPAIAFDDKFSVDSRDFLKVKMNLEEGQTGELRVSTVTGQLLEVKKGQGKEQVEFRSITSSGIYFINLYVNDQRHSKKVLLNN